MLSIDLRYPDMIRGASVRLGLPDFDWETVDYERGLLTVELRGYDGDVHCAYVAGRLTLVYACAGDVPITVAATPGLAERLSTIYARESAIEKTAQAAE